MTQLFQNAIEEASKLPDDQQDAIATLILKVMGGRRPLGLAKDMGEVPDDFDEWDKQMQRDAEAGKLDALIEEAKAEHRARTVKAVDGLMAASKGVTLGKDATLRELIEEGRI